MMKIWFDVIRYNSNLLGGAEEDIIGTFENVIDAIHFQQQYIKNERSIYTSYQIIVNYDDTTDNKES